MYSILIESAFVSIRVFQLKFTIPELSNFLNLGFICNLVDKF